MKLAATLVLLALVSTLASSAPVSHRRRTGLRKRTCRQRPTSSSATPTPSTFPSSISASPTVPASSSTASPASSSTASPSPTAELGSKWDWRGETPARAVNLGNIFLPEAWMGLPSTIDSSTYAGDYWSQCSGRSDACTAEFESVWKDSITAEDVKWMKDNGINMVRLPFGYWAFIGTKGDEPYPTSPLQKENIRRIVELCAEQGIYVLLDVHGLPGSQNGWEHSGHHEDVAGLFEHPELYFDRGVATVKAVADFVVQELSPLARSYISGIQNGNEMEPHKAGDSAAVLAIKIKTLKDFALACYEHTSVINATLVFSDGYLGAGAWADTFTAAHDVAMDFHRYWSFVTKDVTDASFASDLVALADDIANSPVPWFVGEWSVARKSKEPLTDEQFKNTYQSQQALWLSAAGSAMWAFDGQQGKEWNFRKAVESGLVDPSKPFDVSSASQDVLAEVRKWFPKCHFDGCGQ